LAQVGNTLAPQCYDFTHCSDGDTMNTDYYIASVGDPSLLGPLTLRYGFEVNWITPPISESFLVNWLTDFQLVYSPVPEPGTGLLTLAGLLGLAGWRRLRD
jgi:PEP-CTERM motif-containing protein